MKDRIIEDWYKDSKSARRGAPKTEKPKDEASEAQLNTQQIMEAIKRIMAGETARKELTPRAPVLPSHPWEGQIRYLPDDNT